MGAPECLVVLKEPLAEGQIGRFALWLAELGQVTREEKNLGFIIEGTAAALGLDPQKGGDPRVSVRLTPPRLQPLDPTRDSLGKESSGRRAGRPARASRSAPGAPASRITT